MRQKSRESRGTPVSIPIPTKGKIFANGKAIEAIRDITNPDQLRLLFWDGTKATVGSHVECEGRTYTLAPIDPTILQVITFPTGIAPRGFPRDLLADIVKIMTTYTGLSENSVEVTSRCGGMILRRHFFPGQ
jgi:hypothetical protein